MNMDKGIIEGYLDMAAFYNADGNEFAQGLQIGRALSHAEQNAIDPDWLIGAMEKRELDSALVALPKPGGPQG